MRRRSILKFLAILGALVSPLFGEVPGEESSNQLASKLSIPVAGPSSERSERPGERSERPAFEPSTNYEDLSVQGWPVRANRRLILQTNLYAKVLKELDRELEQTSRRLPTPAALRLRKVKIWLELDNAKTPGGVYHPSAVWLSNHDFNPEKARCVEFGVARNFVEWSRWQPYMVMHELAHAWHHQVLGYDYAPLKEAYRLAVESKSYEQVLHIQGQKRRHYGLNNVQEYFAECTEAFFGVNDFYPFVRPEFQEHDPTGARAVEEAWNQKVK